MKGYKVFNPDWTCRGFQYEVGKTYKHDGDISVCGSGFHFCRVAADCFNYYSFSPDNKVAEVEAVGLVESEGNKSVTDEIKIVREIAWQELLEIVNTGKGCTGIGNSGDGNSGDWNSGGGNSGGGNSGNCNSGNSNSGNSNSGYWNSGDWNSGYRNSGNSNSGYCNSGDRNSGDRNSGNFNSGNCNSGSFNSGSFNSGSFNSGFFSTTTPKATLFEKPTELTHEEIWNLDGMKTLRWNYANNWWIYSQHMTDEEKKAHPEHETTGGYLKVIPYKDACLLMWDKLTDGEKQSVKDLPNFDAAIFEEITGIKV